MLKPILAELPICDLLCCWVLLWTSVPAQTLHRACAF